MRERCGQGEEKASTTANGSWTDSTEVISSSGRLFSTLAFLPCFLSLCPSRLARRFFVPQKGQQNNNKNEEKASLVVPSHRHRLCGLRRCDAGDDKGDKISASIFIHRLRSSCSYDVLLLSLSRVGEKHRISSNERFHGCLKKKSFSMPIMTIKLLLITYYLLRKSVGTTKIYGNICSKLFFVWYG